jgi:hypothetical protein
MVVAKVRIVDAVVVRKFANITVCELRAENAAAVLSVNTVAVAANAENAAVHKSANTVTVVHNAENAAVHKSANTVAYEVNAENAAAALPASTAYAMIVRYVNLEKSLQGISAVLRCAAFCFH